MKNRTLFLLLLALCPLAGLTFVSLMDFFKVPPRSAPDDSKMLQELLADSLQRQGSAKTASILQEGLEEVHLILPLKAEGSVFISNMARYGAYGDDMAYVRSWNAVLGNLADTLQPLRKITPESMADSENVTKETLELSDAAFKSIQKANSRLQRYGRELNASLDDFTKKNPDSRLASNSSNYQIKLTEMAGLVSERVDRTQEIHEARVSFLDAQDLFDAENYAECHRLCSKILAVKSLEDSFKTTVREIGYQARARLGLKELDEIAASERRLDDKIEKIQELDRKVSDAGKGLEKAKLESLASDYSEKKTELLVAYIEESCMDEILSDLKELETDPPSTFTQAITEAGEIMVKIRSMDQKMRESTGAETPFPQVKELRKQAQTVLTQLLDERLPNEAEADEKIQEAEMRDGSIVTGYFHAVEENGKTVGFKIYASYEEYQNPTGSKGVTTVDEFHVLPGPSLEARCVGNYLEARKDLMLNLDRRAAWNEFLGKCEKMSKELTTWEEKSQLKAKFSVKKPIAIAKGTLKNENWNIMNEIFN